MTLERQIQQFIINAKCGDAILLSKHGDLKLGTGLILRRDIKALLLLSNGSHWASWHSFFPLEPIMKQVLFWAYMTGKELACPDPEPEESSSLEAAYQKWWDYEASADRPRPDEDQEEHVKRMTRIAWLNGALFASGRRLYSHDEQRP